MFQVKLGVPRDLSLIRLHICLLCFCVRPCAVVLCKTKTPQETSFFVLFEIKHMMSVYFHSAHSFYDHRVFELALTSAYCGKMF